MRQDSARFDLAGGLSPRFIHSVRIEARRMLAGVGVPGAQRFAVETVLEELVTNILEHSGATWLDLGVRLLGAGGRVDVLLADNGRPFDPTQSVRRSGHEPDLSQFTDRRLGLLMIRRLTESVSYTRDELEFNLVHIEFAPERAQDEARP